MIHGRGLIVASGRDAKFLRRFGQNVEVGIVEHGGFEGAAGLVQEVEINAGLFGSSGGGGIVGGCGIVGVGVGVTLEFRSADGLR